MENFTFHKFATVTGTMNMSFNDVDLSQLGANNISESRKRIFH